MGIKADVFILTKNAGKPFVQALDAILNQETPWPYAVHVIDSGSRDGTVDLCQLYPRIQLYQIDPADFQHGRTRNWAMSQGTGEMGVFITQDALPATRTWLKSLVSAVEQRDDIAGAFGRHLPYPNGNPFYARDLNAHFDMLKTKPALRRIEDRARYDRDATYRQLLHFFSDCNACLRRSVWSMCPYPEVDYAEDQLWAKNVLEKGYALMYADEASVYHSHDQTCLQAFRRSFDDAYAFYRLFGYPSCPSLSYLFKWYFSLTRLDMAYARQQRLLRTCPGRVIAMPLYNALSLWGYYLGQRAERLPRAFRRKVSIDQSRKRGVI